MKNKNILILYNMNPVAAGRTPNGRNVYREQYLSSLMLDISNQNKTLNAAKLQKSTGASGAPPGDARTVTEKYQDTDRLKVEVRQQLKDITDPQAAQDIVYELTTEELNFLAGHIPFVIADIKPKFKLGIPAEIFIPYLRKLMRKFVETEGVEYGLQEYGPAGGGGGPGGGMPPPTLNNMPPGPGAPGGLGGAGGPGGPGLDGVLASIPLQNLSATAASVLRRTERQLERIAVIYPTVEDQQIIARCPNPYIRGDYYGAFQEFADNYPTAEQIGQMVESIETAKMVGGKQLMIMTLEPIVDVIQNIDKGALLRMKDIVTAAQDEFDRVQRETEVDRMNAYDEVDAGELANYFQEIQSAPSDPLQSVFGVDASGEDIPEDISSLTMSERLRILEDHLSLGDMSALTISDRLAQLEDASGSSGDTSSLSPLERIQQLEDDISVESWQPGDPIPEAETVVSGQQSVGSAQSNQSSVLQPKARQGDIMYLTLQQYRDLPIKKFKVDYLTMILGDLNFRRHTLGDVFDEVIFPNDDALALWDVVVGSDEWVTNPDATEAEMEEIYAFLLYNTVSPIIPGDAIWRDTEIAEFNPPVSQDFVDQVSPEKTGPLPELMTREQLSSTKKGQEATPQGITELDLSNPRRLFGEVTPGMGEVTPGMGEVRPSGNGLRGCGSCCGCGKCKKMALGKMKSGRGKNILIGRGLAIPTPTQKVSPSNIDFSKGIKPEPAYVPFGKHLINKWRLNDDVVMIRTPKGGAITNIPTQRVSKNLSRVLRTFVGGSIPDFESLNSLSEEDKYTLSNIAKTSRLSHSVPNPNKSKQEEEDTEFEILRGQIASGQDNKDAVKKFKLLLVKMMNQKRIPKGQGIEILTELAVLGH